MGRRKSRTHYLVGTERNITAGQMDWKGLFVTKMDEGRALVERGLSRIPV